jgi:hypothetical protein
LSAKLFLKIVTFLKNWLIAFIKNLIMLAVAYKVLLWGWGSIHELIMLTNESVAWLAGFNKVVFYFGIGVLICATFLLGRFSVTQLLSFKFKKDADKNSYFAIKQKAVDGGWYYGFVNTVRVINKIKIYDAVIFSGGLTRKFEMTESEFVRLNLSVPDVLFYGYVAVIFPFLAKSHINHDEVNKTNPTAS